MIPKPEKSKRDRSWEKRQRSGEYCQASYRHVPREVRDRITEIAQELYVSADEVGRAFLEYALEAFEAGELVLDPVLHEGKLVLFDE
jgi:hypothetical protein